MTPKKDSSQHRAKKHLGQNFLIDPLIKERIVKACALSTDDTILEIGPGQGAITELIAPHVKKVIAIEKDVDLLPNLHKKFTNSNVEIIHTDILQFNLNTLPDNVKIISNLPYNIATPIIENVIHNRNKFTAFYMTVQLEYGQRLIARANTKAYGSLSCFVQYHSNTEMLFRISHKAFKPQPKVQSCFLKMDFQNTKNRDDINKKLLFQLIKSAFAQRRKTILNSIGSLIEKDQLTVCLNKLDIDTQARAENISLDQYISIAHMLAGHA